MLLVAEPYRRLFDSLGLHSAEAVIAHFRPRTPSPPQKVLVRPARLEGPDVPAQDVFFKQYCYAQPAWSFIGRRSKARREFENYAVFHRLQVPAAGPIAAGEIRDRWGRLSAAIIVTEAVPASVTLLEYMQGPGRDRSQAEPRARRRDLVRQLAIMTRRIHEAGFFHNDLVWRNVLVSTPASQSPRVCWIDCPRGRFARWPFQHRRRRMKDLASLDKPAGRWCTRGERVLFIREYLGLARLNADAKQLIRDTLRYRRTRWPEDWDGN